MELTKKEAWCKSFFERFSRESSQTPDGWISPTTVGWAYGSEILGRNNCHSSTGSPICKALVKKGVLERNSKGHYRLVMNNY